MTISEALKTVGDAYIPGTADHYGRMKPDPWQAAHDDLDRIMRLKDADIFTAGSEHFVSRCLKLINAYRELKAPAKDVSPRDGFYIGDAEKVKKWQMRKNQHCIQCEVKENLSIISDPKDPSNVLIVCADCKKRFAA